MVLNLKWNCSDHKNLEVFFYGMVQLFAHYIPYLRDLLLTSVDFLVCLGIYINRIPAEIVIDRCQE